MAETKTKERFRKAFDIFFAEDFNGQNAMTVVADNAAVSDTSLPENSRKAERYYTIFKRLFLFFPGVLILHIVSISFAAFYSEVGINYWVLFWFASGIFMIWAGIGDLKNKRHLLSASPVIAIGLFIGFLQSFLPTEAFQFLFAITVPVSFIGAILIKGAIDRLEDNKSGLTNREPIR